MKLTEQETRDIYLANLKQEVTSPSRQSITMEELLEFAAYCSEMADRHRTDPKWGDAYGGVLTILEAFFFSGEGDQWDPSGNSDALMMISATVKAYGMAHGEYHG